MITITSLGLRPNPINYVFGRDSVAANITASYRKQMPRAVGSKPRSYLQSHLYPDMRTMEEKIRFLTPTGALAFD